MAGLLTLEQKLQHFRKEYYYRSNQADENRKRENQAATLIQSWFRGCLERAYLSHLHKKAIIIQKIWRGFTARARVRQMVKAAYFIMKMNFYEEMAVRIQQRWRGFFARKHIHSFYARKSYMEGILKKNECVRIELDEICDLQKKERESLKMIQEQTAKVYQAHRLHYLLSTEQCPGVFNSPFRQAPHEMELLLKQVKPSTPNRMVPKSQVSFQGIPGPAAHRFSATESPWTKSTRTCSFRPTLPPIARRNYQVMVVKARTKSLDVED
ncbi:hypothetical protein OJAV_G00024610 [Oryzias javanicus]|uniref:Spermatogenesis-associated protein 17 n=1 Tax=Oryzias javanicus TaxID=123683 RepID=A0A437DIJ5_ORYJA|nr:hypothetical protein OJAV_G00024610 [Oryzias javanicus]